jgi:large subunit ribosomal protein L30e
MSLDEKMLEKPLKAILKTGKYSLGMKEASKSLKSVKLLIYSDSLDEMHVSKLKRACVASSVPTIAYSGSSVTLGRLCGRPFKVSVLSVRSANEEDLAPLLRK